MVHKAAKFTQKIAQKYLNDTRKYIQSLKQNSFWQKTVDIV